MKPRSIKPLNLNKAFTLVELAIVIVIIGLLVGGVLAGQELIKQSKIRSQIKKFEDYNTAIITFKGKYGFLPGDIPASVAQRMGISNVNTNATVPPNGDGMIGDQNGNVPPLTSWPEPRLFFVQLWEEKMIKDVIQVVSSSMSVGETFPYDATGTGTGFAAFTLADSNLYYFMGINGGTRAGSDIAGQVSPKPTITPEFASDLDLKIDNGIPSSGNVRAIIVSNNISTQFSNDTATNNCLGANDQSYNLSTNSPTCRIAVKSSI